MFSVSSKTTVPATCCLEFSIPSPMTGNDHKLERCSKNLSVGALVFDAACRLGCKCICRIARRIQKEQALLLGKERAHRTAESAGWAFHVDRVLYGQSSGHDKGTILGTVYLHYVPIHLPRLGMLLGGHHHVSAVSEV